jgi:MoaA/NifB/PqqE/SkfB family radical SAM enzyme
MCDIWKANHDKREIASEELAKHIASFRKLGVRHVTLSGGEALMHSNLWNFCDQLKSTGARLSLLSTGLSIKANADQILAHMDDLIVSLDGSPDVHNTIRGIPHAFEKLQEGVSSIKVRNPKFRITGRCVLQKLNYFDLPNIIAAAESIGLDQISFLAADVSSTAFNRPQPWEIEKVSHVGLNTQESKEFEQVVRKAIVDFSHLFKRKFIAENPSKMLDLVRYYRALLNEQSFPERHCNAPWVSAVVEVDGAIRPCFFHEPYGNIYENGFSEIINSQKAVSFRKGLNVKKNPICERCVCSLKL